MAIICLLITTFCLGVGAGDASADLSQSVDNEATTVQD